MRCRHDEVVELAEKLTSAKLAKALNLSQATISRVLNNSPLVSEKTRARVLKAIEELGYAPDAVARALATQRVDTLGFLVVNPKRFAQPIRNLLADPFTQILLATVEEKFRANGWRLLVSVIEGGLQEIIQLVRTHRIEGAVINVAHLDEELIEEFRQTPGLREHPFVLTEMVIPDLEVPTVWADNADAAARAVMHLTNLGHREIGFITGSEQLFSGPERLRGFKEAMESKGLSPHLIFRGNYEESSGYEAFVEMFKQKKMPTALIAANDRMAIGAMRAAKMLGMRIPDDIAIMGIDDIELAAYVEPGLTTIHYPIRELGEKAAEMLLAQCRREEVEKRVCISNNRLVVRGSCGANRGAEQWLPRA
ncbi:MAG: LacI family DNA-binding transcriptional regulator [Bacillota bacterium]